MQLQIEPIQKRAGESLPVPLTLTDAAATAMVAVAIPAAGAGIGGGHQGDQGGEDRALLGTADLHGAVLEGLPQLIQHRSRKFRQLIEKEHPPVGQAEFPRTGRASTPQQGGCRATVVRRSKGALPLEWLDAMEMAGDGVDARDGERFLLVQGWQQPWQLMGQAGLAAAWGTHEQEMVAACGREGQGP